MEMKTYRTPKVAKIEKKFFTENVTHPCGFRFLILKQKINPFPQKWFKQKIKYTTKRGYFAVNRCCKLGCYYEEVAISQSMSRCHLTV